MTIYEKMHGEELYLPNDEKLAAERLKTLEKRKTLSLRQLRLC